jgi:hypothetical protein
MTELDRREFLVVTAAVSGGMALSLCLPETEAAERGAGMARLNSRPWLPPAEGGVEVNPWIVIAPDDRVLIRVNQSDLGQGVLTSNPMMIAEELECDWSKVQSVYAEPNRHMREHELYDHLHTEASSSVRLGRVLYQQAGASARERLKAAAAQQWNVPVSEVEARNSVLTHKPTGRTLRFGEVAAKAASIKLDREPAIKTPDQYRLIGTRVQRFDVELKSRAQAVYGIDVRVPQHGLRRDQAVAQLWRKTEEFRFQCHPLHAGHNHGHSNGGYRSDERHRGRSRHVVARKDGARQIADCLGPRSQRAYQHQRSGCAISLEDRGERSGGCRQRQCRDGARQGRQDRRCGV